MTIPSIAEGLSDKALRVMTHVRFVEKGWETANPFSPIVTELIDAGLFRRADGRCGFEAFKDSFIVPTELGLAVRQYLLAPPPSDDPEGE